MTQLWVITFQVWFIFEAHWHSVYSTLHLHLQCAKSVNSLRRRCVLKSGVKVEGLICWCACYSSSFSRVEAGSGNSLAAAARVSSTSQRCSLFTGRIRPVLCVTLCSAVVIMSWLYRAVLWYCWLGLLTCKNRCRIAYTVSVETLNSA